MVTKVSDIVTKKHYLGDGHKRSRKKKEKEIKKRRDAEEEEEYDDDDDDDEKEDDAETDEGSDNEEKNDDNENEQSDNDEVSNTNDEVCEEAEDGTRKCRKRRHIRPCLCDLSPRIKQKVSNYLKYKAHMIRKHEKRVKEIEEELARIEEARLEAEREKQEQEELFGDEYEVVGKKKKRKKRSARRASMVSLGVKQVINWRKQPRIAVKFNMTSEMRTKYQSYCGTRDYPLTPIQEINYHKTPNIAVRMTWVSTSRLKISENKKESLSKAEDKKRPFETPYYV